MKTNLQDYVQLLFFNKLTTYCIYYIFKSG